MSDDKESSAKASHFALTALVYLLGLLLGGLFVGIIAPLRSVVQADFGIDDAAGIWIINIYTLFYAAGIPVIGSLGDRIGRERIFAACLGIFAVGSLMCGLSQACGSFAWMLVGRVVQAFGAGGVIPVATAQIGATAPQDKRGMWLGITSAVAGLANVVGAAAGSAIIGIIGVEAWAWIFYAAVPCAAVLAGLTAKMSAGVSHADERAKLPKTAAAGGNPRSTFPIDVPGTLLMVVSVLCFLTGLGRLDFTALATSLTDALTLALLAAAIVCAVLFCRVERAAACPVFHMEYVRNPRIVIVMVVSFFVGCCIISMQLIPEFAEAVLGVGLGSGGYYMAIIGVFAIAGPPLCGKLIDRLGGAKPVLAGGLVVTALGFVLLGTLAIFAPGVPTMLLGLAVVGLGMGFTMGTPLNYMILQNVPKDESGAAIASIALVRQIGTTVAPAFYVSIVSTGGFAFLATPLAGYSTMMLAVAAFNLLCLPILLFYRK